MMDTPDTTESEAVTKTYVFMEGCNCLDTHWLACLGISMFALAVSLMLWGLTVRLGPDDAEDEGEDDDVGAWRFVKALWISGFTLACLTFCMACLSFARNPTTETGCPQLCADSGDGAEFECDSLVACLAGSCAMCAWMEPDWDACIDNMRCCRCGECGELPSISCDGCPDCSAKNFVPSCDCASWVSLDCCPQCSGLTECCNTAYKILCCQCQIQV